MPKKRTSETPGKTFELTASAATDISPEKRKSPKNYRSQTTRDIIKASK